MGVLGPVTALVESRAAAVRPIERALLARLALSVGRAIPADQLIDDLWGENLPRDPSSALRVTASRLRRAIAGAADEIETVAGGYRLAVGTEVDAEQFRALVRSGREMAREQRHELAASRWFREALKVWQGPALADVRGFPFAQAAAVALEDERLRVLEARIGADLASGRHAELVSERSVR